MIPDTDDEDVTVNNLRSWPLLIAWPCRLPILPLPLHLRRPTCEKLCRKGRYVWRWPSIPWINMPTWISHPFQKVWLVAVEISRHPVIHLEFRWFFGMFFWGGTSYLLSWGVWMSRCLFFVSVETTRYSPETNISPENERRERWTFLWKWSLFRGHVNLTFFCLGGMSSLEVLNRQKPPKKTRRTQIDPRWAQKPIEQWKKGPLVV